jgi:hypothetical protein
LGPVWCGWPYQHSSQLQWNWQTSLPGIGGAYNKAMSPGEETGMLKKHKWHGIGVRMLHQQDLHKDLFYCHNRQRVISTISEP